MNPIKNFTDRAKTFGRASLMSVMLLVAIVGMLLSPPDAEAQPAYFTVPLWTNAVYSGNVTNVANSAFQVSRGKSLAIVLEYKNFVASGTNGPLNFYLDGSIDNGLHYTTVFPLSGTASSYRAGWGSTNTEIFIFPATNGALINLLTHLKVTRFNSINTNVCTNVLMTARFFDRLERLP